MALTQCDEEIKCCVDVDVRSYPGMSIAVLLRRSGLGECGAPRCGAVSHGLPLVLEANAVMHVSLVSCLRAWPSEPARANAIADALRALSRSRVSFTSVDGHAAAVNA